MADPFPLDLDALLEVLNHLNIGVYITDLDRRIRLWNRKAEEITGYPAAEVVGTSCHDDILVHVDTNGRALCATDLCPLYRAMMLNRESEEPVILFAKKADGRRLAVSVSVAPLRDKGGKVVGGIETFRDETTRILDLELARKIQRGLLPASLPKDPRVRFDAGYYPCELVGGDFYCVREIDAARYGVIVADVAGHGVSAALYTMWLSSLCDSLGQLAAEPARFVAAVNRELVRLVLPESFSTAFYAVVEPARGTVTYTNAGHPPALHFRGGGAVARLESHGLPLGVLEDQAYGATSLRLGPGELLLCYTDGITEATRPDGGMLGIDGLAELVTELRRESDDGLPERVYGHVARTSGDVALADDVVLLSLIGTAAPPTFDI